MQRVHQSRVNRSSRPNSKPRDVNAVRPEVSASSMAKRPTNDGRPRMDNSGGGQRMDRGGSTS